MIGKKKTQREIIAHRDAICRIAFCEELGADKWPYHATPTYFYNLWERYQLHGDSIDYPWNHRRYPQQREADMFMARLIHQIYRRVCGFNVTQLEINFKE